MPQLDRDVLHQASELLKRAELYREEIKAMSPEDPRRRQLESFILDLLDQADALSQTVRNNVKKS